ncbi:MAG: SGNH/GDSL hydrolase family protein [Bacteroidetes bacterium]|nr:SGNH/GDSL hydrolase family protein [Bacteroidota bacterium]
MNLSFLALGDSYTIGEGVLHEDRWPSRLTTRLRDEGFSFDLPHIIATTGWTTTDLKEAIRNHNLKPDYDLVSLLIGVNNQYRGWPVSDYENDFAELLQDAIRLSGNRPDRVLVLSIPDWGRTPFASDRNPQRISQEIDSFNQVNQHHSLKRGVHWVDVTTVTRQTPLPEDWTTDDGLHPSGILYDQWVRLVLPLIINQLRTS